MEERCKAATAISFTDTQSFSDSLLGCNPFKAKKLLQLLPSLEIVEIMRCEYLASSALELLLRVPSFRILSLNSIGNLEELIALVCKSKDLSVLFLRKSVWLDGIELSYGSWRSLFTHTDEELAVHCTHNHHQTRDTLLDVYLPKT